MKIFLLAHSGGNVWEYKHLFQQIRSQEFIPIELPGNLSKLSYKLPDTLEEYVDIAEQKIRENIGVDERIGIFGHSFGGYMIYELISRLSEHVEKVVVSCSTPFHLYQKPPKTYDYSKSFGYPAKSSPDIIRFFDPIIEHKLQCIEDYKKCLMRNESIEVLEVTSIIISASKDRLTRDASQWKRYFKESKMTLLEVPGGHFYWKTDQTAIELLLSIMKDL